MYIGNDLQIAHPSYKIIDDISSGFNGSTTSFALQVSGATPVPFPISTQQVMISVNGVVQEPDPNGSAGFKLLGSNIVFSSAPANGHAFFGVINAGADYVTAGSEFPDGSATAPSFTFQDDQDTGWFRSGSGAVGFSANGVNTIGFDGNGLTVTGDATFTGDSSKNLFWDKSDGQLEFADNAKAVFGTGSDLQIYHDGSHSYITDAGTGRLHINTSQLRVNNAADNEIQISATENGAVDLYYDGVKKFETTSGGIQMTGHVVPATNNTYDLGTNSHRFRNLCIALDIDVSDNGKLLIGNDDDLQIYHDGTNSYIQDSGTGELRLRGTTIRLTDHDGSENFANFNDNGSVELYHNNVRKLETFSSGVQLDDNLVIKDSKKAFFGDGYDLQIYHDATDNIITTNNSKILKILCNGTEKAIEVNPNGNVELYFDNSKKFESISAGAKVTGELHIDSNGSLIKENQLKFSPSGAAYIDHSTVSQNIIFRTSNSSALDTTALTLASNGNSSFAGTVSDSKGNLRSIPNDTKTSAYTLVASDAGKMIRITTGGVTVPNSVFAEGDAVSIINQSGSDQTITAGSGFTLYNAGDGSAGSRTLAGRGMVTMMFAASDAAYISGAGLS
jgi:hypothetical protein